MTNSEQNTPFKLSGKRLICSAGQDVFEQDTPAHQLFYIESGCVDVTIHKGEHTITLAQLGPGEIFGEMGILGEQMRSATVTARKETLITIIDRKDLDQRIEALEDDFISSLLKTLVSRLQNANEGQLRYFTDLSDLQDRISGLMNKVNSGIPQSNRKEFSAEVTPLLEQIEALFDKYS